jgi:anaerobic nitric oxide reductase transcription regulator
MVAIGNAAEALERLGTLARRLGEATGEASAFSAHCLDAIIDVLGADRGLVLLADEADDGFVVPIEGRRAGRTLTRKERTEMSLSIARRVSATRECVVWEPGADSSESMAAFGIVGAIAAPLSLPQDAAPFGVLYADFRDLRSPPAAYHRPFFEVAAQLISAFFAQGRALEQSRERLRAMRAFHAQPDAPYELAELVAGDALAGLRAELKSLQASDVPVLIVGESGTGKTLLANALAAASGRRPLVRALLGVSDDMNTLASEMFGHERGAFSGALTRRVGLVELADKGSLVFDELLNLPLGCQKLLLDVVQFGTFRPLGWDRAEPKKTAVRVIACTNGDVDDAIATGRLRPDLYYRLAGAVVHLPPLRERREDIPHLARAILDRIAPDFEASAALLSLLANPTLRWPGNVRQLEMALRRAHDRAKERRSPVLEPRDVLASDVGTAALPLLAAETERSEAPPSAWVEFLEQRRALERREKVLLESALANAGGNAAAAARTLGLSRTSLLSRMHTLGIAKR